MTYLVSYTRERVDHIGSFVKTTRCGDVGEYVDCALRFNWNDEVLASPKLIDYNPTPDKKFDPDTCDGRMYTWNDDKWTRQKLQFIDSQKHTMEWRNERESTPEEILNEILKECRTSGYCRVSMDAYYTVTSKIKSDEHEFTIVNIKDSPDNPSLFIVDSYIHERNFTIRPFIEQDFLNFLEKHDRQSWSTLCACKFTSINQIYDKLEIQLPM